MSRPADGDVSSGKPGEQRRKDAVDEGLPAAPRCRAAVES